MSAARPLSVSNAAAGIVGARRPRIALWRRVTVALALWRSRRALAELPPERLADIGLTEAEAAREAARHVWDVPAHWLR